MRNATKIKRDFKNRYFNILQEIDDANANNLFQDAVTRSEEFEISVRTVFGWNYGEKLIDKWRNEYKKLG